MLEDKNTENTATTPDFETMSAQEMRDYISAGGNTGNAPKTEPAPKTDDKSDGDGTTGKADEKPTDKTGDAADEPENKNQEGEPGGEPDGDGKTVEGEEDVLAFEFTENADAETFREEADSFLEQVELIPQVQAIIDHYKTAAVRAEEQVARFDSLGDFDTTRRTVNAVNKLVEFRQDEATGRFVPDASGIVELLQKDFQAEKQQVLIDLNQMPSDKYPGIPVFQEFIRDYFDLDNKAMNTLNQFLQNKGEFSLPKFTPPGINENVAEAYWKSFDRDDIQKLVEVHVDTIQDPQATEEEKQQARTALQTINARLGQIQSGLNADRERKQAENDFKQQQQERIEQAAETSFVDTTNAVANSLSAKLAKSLTFVEGNSAATVADGIVSLVRQAYSEREWEAKAGQARLAERGIVHDWTKGREILDDLFTLENKLASQLADKNTNPRAIELTKKAKSEILRSLRAEELEIVGKITKSVIGSANKSLQKKIDAAPKIKAVRTKISSDGTQQKPSSNVDDMSVEELRQMISGGPYKAATQGDLSGFRQ